jgi:hypothetical protein
LQTIAVYAVNAAFRHGWKEGFQGKGMDGWAKGKKDGGDGRAGYFNEKRQHSHIGALNAVIL